MDIILLHGALGSGAQLEQLEKLLSIDANVHKINFSGHGGKSFDKEFGIQQFCAELKSFIDQNPQKKFCAFGYSMGGYVALYLERYFPGKLAAIYTLATKFEWNESSSIKEAAMLNAETILEKVPSFALQLELRHGADIWKILLEKTAKMMIEMGKNPPLKDDDLSKIEVPVIISRGDLDKMVSKEESVAAANNLRHGFFKGYNNWQHPIEKVDLNILARDILDFFDRRE